jgi:hypothetical protein
LAWNNFSIRSNRTRLPMGSRISSKLAIGGKFYLSQLSSIQLLGSLQHWISKQKWRSPGMDSIGRSGGIGLFWSVDIPSTWMEIQTYGPRHFDAIIRSGTDGQQDWRLSCIYGEPRVENHHKTREGPHAQPGYSVARNAMGFHR